MKYATRFMNPKWESNTYERGCISEINFKFLVVFEMPFTQGLLNSKHFLRDECLYKYLNIEPVFGRKPIIKKDGGWKVGFYWKVAVPLDIKGDANMAVCSTFLDSTSDNLTRVIQRWGTGIGCVLVNRSRDCGILRFNMTGKKLWLCRHIFW